LISAIKDVHSGGSPMSSNIARKVVQSFRREAAGAGGVEDLTPREREVLKFLASGDLYKEIADHLGITITTVNTHVRRIYMKLQVRSRGQAVAKFAHLSPADQPVLPSSASR
jgi:DNA-binding NarL/FixJ family response regulator